jgi:hypothetical protein
LSSLPPVVAKIKFGGKKLEWKMNILFKNESFKEELDDFSPLEESDAH